MKRTALRPSPSSPFAAHRPRRELPRSRPRRRRTAARPHAQARPSAPHQRRPRLRRPPRLALPLHHPGDRRPPDDLRRRGPARGPRARHGHRADHRARSPRPAPTTSSSPRPTPAARPRARSRIVCGPTAGPDPAHGLEQLVRLGEPRHRRHHARRRRRHGRERHGRPRLPVRQHRRLLVDPARRQGPGPRRRAPRRPAARSTPNSRFPDMKAMTDYIHAKGLKAGIYTSPGPLTCAGYAAAYQHEEQRRPSASPSGASTS
ncbi:MAG: hypothetical protein MZW92_03080 [Comamonadaceae bacterium]|nr:hypothetical protein [Comamonadaceae bacterium]